MSILNILGTFSVEFEIANIVGFFSSVWQNARYDRKNQKEVTN